MEIGKIKRVIEVRPVELPKIAPERETERPKPIEAPAEREPVKVGRP